MLTLILLSISLSLDAFAVASAHSLRNIRIPLRSKFIIALMGAFYFGISLWAGEKLSGFFNPAWAKGIGVVLMLCICLWMTLQLIFNKNQDSDKENNPPKKTVFEFSLKSIGLTFKIIRNPMLSDIDQSQDINPIEAIFLGTALSIDSVSVGIGYALMGGMHFVSFFIAGAIQFIFLCLGDLLGKKIMAAKLGNSENFQIISIAVMLILTLIRIFA